MTQREGSSEAKFWSGKISDYAYQGAEGDGVYKTVISRDIFQEDLAFRFVKR